MGLGVATSLPNGHGAMQLRKTDPSRHLGLCRGFWPLSSCEPSAGRPARTWAPGAHSTGQPPTRRRAGGQPPRGELVLRARPCCWLWAAGRQPSRCSSVLPPSPPSQQWPPVCCPEVESEACWGKAGETEAGPQGHCPMGCGRGSWGASPHLPKISLISGSWRAQRSVAGWPSLVSNKGGVARPFLGCRSHPTPLGPEPGHVCKNSGPDAGRAQSPCGCRGGRAAWVPGAVGQPRSC